MFFSAEKVPARKPRLEWTAGFGSAGFTAPLLARFLIVLARLEKLQDPFALHFLFQALEGLFKRLVLTDIDF